MFQPKIAVMWRHVNESDVWFGVAVVSNLEDLGWQLDEHLDPTNVEITEINQHSLCWNEDKVYKYSFDENGDGNDEDDYPNIVVGSLEFSEAFHERHDEDTKWHKLLDVIDGIY